jgi:hypothetical protein
MILRLALATFLLYDCWAGLRSAIDFVRVVAAIVAAVAGVFLLVGFWTPVAGVLDRVRTARWVLGVRAGCCQCIELGMFGARRVVERCTWLWTKANLDSPSVDGTPEPLRKLCHLIGWRAFVDCVVHVPPFSKWPTYGRSQRFLERPIRVNVREAHISGLGPAHPLFYRERANCRRAQP